MTKIAIIGAGISGLSAAHLLNEGVEVSLFEKARGVSGRSSTRRAEPYFFDHGAQYFTARTKPFQTFIQPLLDKKIIKRWNPRYVKFKDNHIVERQNWIDENPRYVGVPGMNEVAKYLAQGVSVNTNTRIVSLEYQEKWMLIDDKNQQYGDFDWVISTVPSPQTVELLPRYFNCHADIEAIKMGSCFSLMLGFDKSLQLDFDAAHVTHADVSWIAVNSHKPGRSDHYTLLVHSSAEYAQAYFKLDCELIIDHLITETSRILGHDIRHAEYKTLHKWRYANNVAREDRNDVFLDPVHKLAACGDWCNGGRVEGAFTSAYNLVNAMKGNVL